MRIEIKRDLCISAASCIALAPEVFELDEEGIAVVKDADGATAEVILQAAQSCPTKAIYVWDDAGKRLWPDPETSP